MAELRVKQVATGQASTAGIAWLIVLSLVAILVVFIPSGLLAESLDDYWRYLAAVPEHGEGAAMNADEARFGVGFSLFLLVGVGLGSVGTAAVIAAGTGLPVRRTAVAATLGFVLVTGVFLGAWLTFGV